MSAGRFSLLFALLTFISCFATVGLRITIVSDEQSKELASDVASSILSLVPQNVFVSIEMDGATLTSNDLASIEEEFALSFSISYDATRNAYYASWLEFDSVVYSCSYSPRAEKPYREFVRECAHYPLEKAALRLLVTGKFEKYLRVTYHPSVDEYSSFSPNGELFAFITDRLGGNRNIALLNLTEGTLKVLPVHGSSEYFPRF
ncbi:MAG: hypothetical protein H5T94_07160, partial [Pseudothermotoga sp.]|nr:hypothetical protein [Pseudothermotoga sp.]